MIQSLRTRHRFMIGALSVVLPVAFVGGIVARKPIPTMAPVPSLSGDARSTFETTLWDRDDLWTQHGFRTRLVAASDRSRGVVVTMESELSKPDVLLYWSPGFSGASPIRICWWSDRAVGTGRNTSPVTIWSARSSSGSMPNWRPSWTGRR